MAASQFYIPDLEEFFTNFMQLLRQCLDCLRENVNGGLAEFLGRRLEEFQRSLRVIYARVEEFRRDSQELLNDVEQLLEIVSHIKQNLELLYTDDFFEEPQSNAALCTTVNNGLPGRPRYHLTQDQIQTLRYDLGFNWVDIAGIMPQSSALSVRETYPADQIFDQIEA